MPSLSMTLAFRLLEARWIAASKETGEVIVPALSAVPSGLTKSSIAMAVGIARDRAVVMMIIRCNFDKAAKRFAEMFRCRFFVPFSCLLIFLFILIHSIDVNALWASFDAWAVVEMFSLAIDVTFNDKF